jgi:hypothetical protein
VEETEAVYFKNKSNSSDCFLHIISIFNLRFNLISKTMGRRKDAPSTHAMLGTEKKKRKVVNEDPAERTKKPDNGPSGWEEIEAVEAPRDDQGMLNIFESAQQHNSDSYYCFPAN